jgi:hypothetical protein
MIRYNPSLDNYIATVNGIDIHCHNRATAETLLKNETVQRVHRMWAVEQLDFEQIFGCALVYHRGLPAIQWNLTGRVEPVHNWATARTIQNDSMMLLDQWLKGE